MYKGNSLINQLIKLICNLNEVANCDSKISQVSKLGGEDASHKMIHKGTFIKYNLKKNGEIVIG